MKAFFVFWLVFFTIFGGGRVYRWSYVCETKQGLVYEVDLRSLEIQDPVLSLMVRTSHGEKARTEHWTFNLDRNTLTTEYQPEQNVASGSVASRVLLFLQAQGKLKSPSLRGTDSSL